MTQHFTRCNPGSISRTVALSLGAVKAPTCRLLSLRASRGRWVDELEPETECYRAADGTGVAPREMLGQAEPEWTLDRFAKALNAGVKSGYFDRVRQ